MTQPQPEVLREVGYDQTDVPSEHANEAPDVEPTEDDVAESETGSS